MVDMVRRREWRRRTGREAMMFAVRCEDQVDQNRARIIQALQSS